MKGDPCTVCGGTDLNLIDGYYYCVECGTQDENIRETIVERVQIGDGTVAVNTIRKIRATTGVKMSAEWYKWHAYNFVLSGIADEVIALGAEPSFKAKVLWIWSKYIKKFQIKEENLELFYDVIQDNTSKDDLNEKDDNEEDDEEIERNIEKEMEDLLEMKIKTMNIFSVTTYLFHAILITALNLDNSPLQYSHITRYAKENRISYVDHKKFIPEGFNIANKKYKPFNSSRFGSYKNSIIRDMQYNLFKKLKIGKPNIPDMKVIVDRFVTELCLTEDFKTLVYAVMSELPWRPLLIKVTSMDTYLNFEGLAMCYILITLKICFGLDDIYENKMSDEIEKINENNNYSKCYKFDKEVTGTDRLFCFREWIHFLHVRTLTLCKFYLPFAIKKKCRYDEHDLLHMFSNRYKKDYQTNIKHKVAMDILNKISGCAMEFEYSGINFPPSLKPYSDYTDIVLEYIKDDDIIKILSEDFSKYSMKYCTVDFSIRDSYVLAGVDISNKVIEKDLCDDNEEPQEMVYVRNCDNKNWNITKPPTNEHITKHFDTENVREINTPIDSEEKETKFNESNKQLKEEDNGIDIFSDNFDEVCLQQSSYEFNNNDKTINSDIDSGQQISVDVNKTESDDLIGYDEKTFDREEAIKQLVRMKCKKHGITVPYKYRLPSQTKRLVKYTGDTLKGRKKLVRGSAYWKYDSKAEINEILDKYREKALQEAVERECANRFPLGLLNDNLLLNTTITNEVDNNNINQTESLGGINQESTNGNIENNINTENNLNSDHSDVEQGSTYFDDKKFDIEQLYVKMNEAESEEVQIDHSEIDEIFSRLTKPDKETTEVDKNNLIALTETGNNVSKNMYMEENEAEYLISNSNINKYGYWINHNDILWHHSNDTTKYNLLFEENYPRSFNFLLDLCSSICEHSKIEIYAVLCILERKFFKNIRRKAK